METTTPYIGEFKDYQHEALVTASMGKGRTIEGFVRVCGLVGETAELRAALRTLGSDRQRTDDIKKELGDVLWYAATLAHWFGLGVYFNFLTLQETANRNLTLFQTSLTESVSVPAGKLAELMKKHLGHDKPIEDFCGAELGLMMDVFMGIAHVANLTGLHLGEVAALNIAKLRLRHGGGGFTTAAQNAKADEHVCTESGGCKSADCTT